MPPHEGTEHGEIRTNKKTMSVLSPYEAIRAVIEKFKSANEPIPTSLHVNQFIILKDQRSVQ